MLKYNVLVEGEPLTTDGKPREYNLSEARRIAKAVEGEVYRTDRHKETRRMFRMTDLEVEMLDKIAGYYFITVDRNRSAALRLIIHAEFAAIKEVRRKELENGTQPSYVAPPTFGKA